ncbi:MAG: uroporphyrinogen decarboxylase family protein [Sedimentisphaerales bacterium]
MTNKEHAMAVLNYGTYGRLPIVHFGFWHETLVKWANQGYITMEQALSWGDCTPVDKQISDKLGFDFGWYNCFSPATGLLPAFEEKVIEELSDGTQKVLDSNGAIVLRKSGAGSIPAEIDHLLKNRQAWQEHYLPKLQFAKERVTNCNVNTGAEFKPFVKGGLDFLKDHNRQNPLGLYCGSLFGQIRNWLGVEGVSYLYMDDELLYDEIINTVGELCYKCTETALYSGAKFDFAHFWEDICFKNGPLVTPSVFAQKVGPHYKCITDLVRKHGIEIISLDCDGLIDSLIPIWLKNGINTMFPIEVGTWNASIKPWREQYGKALRGVGGMNKVVFSKDYAAIDAEIERLKPLVELGGYIPCPDHRIAPDAEWENVQYYCEKARIAFGK